MKTSTPIESLSSLLPWPSRIFCCHPNRRFLARGNNLTSGPHMDASQKTWEGSAPKRDYSRPLIIDLCTKSIYARFATNVKDGKRKDNENYLASVAIALLPSYRNKIVVIQSFIPNLRKMASESPELLEPNSEFRSAHTKTRRYRTPPRHMTRCRTTHIAHYWQ